MTEAVLVALVTASGMLAVTVITQYFQLRAQRARQEHEQELQRLQAEEARVRARHDYLRKYREQLIDPLRSWLSRFVGASIDVAMLLFNARQGLIPQEVVVTKLGALAAISNEQPSGRQLLFQLSDTDLMTLVERTVEMSGKVKTASQQCQPQSMTEDDLRELQRLTEQLKAQLAKCNSALEDYVLAEKENG